MARPKKKPNYGWTKKERKGLTKEDYHKRHRSKEYVNKMSPQAQRIIDKFGGVYEIIKMLREVDPDTSWAMSTIYRWTYPKSKGGTNGLIPTKAMRLIAKNARLYGVLLEHQDFYPEENY